MSASKLLRVLSMIFAVITVVLIVYKYSVVTSVNQTQYSVWANLSLSVMFLIGGLARYLEKAKYALGYFGVGIFLVVVVVITTIVGK